MSDLVAYVDGGSRGNPGPSGIGVIIEDPSGEAVRIAKWIGHHDNNVAEYAALLEALQHAVEVKAKSLRVYSDSEVVVKQMTGEYTCQSPQPLFSELGLPQIGPYPDVLNRSHSPRVQQRSQRSRQPCRPVPHGSVMPERFSRTLGFAFRPLTSFLHNLNCWLLLFQRSVSQT